MLAERNDNKKVMAQCPVKPVPSPKKAVKGLKENMLQFNSKELLLKASKLQVSEITLPTEDFLVSETNKIKTDYLKKIMANELSKCPESFRAEFLKSHLLTQEIRARMVLL
jgi:hypothetical protein